MILEDKHKYLFEYCIEKLIIIQSNLSQCKRYQLCHSNLLQKHLSPFVSTSRHVIHTFLEPLQFRVELFILNLRHVVVWMRMHPWLYKQENSI